ncbi:MAG: ATPase, T2SS/T4P/T4SS family [Candidatus Rehaiarchaeum fermentans]|nr:ATPase, T2SS/T4P/T4SS family [Candidatus Rehaiarchaeum fermentans]MCW1293390.1 ATPase, T2SS/T4P/T4SS family [Candidatus Rehaiarchaeum fermentans]MCW1311322.1 ATPase, T2SS/T4P/T4SS family [Candidatus Rehaiarchaeum fermentans]
MEILDQYKVEKDGLVADVKIIRDPQKFVLQYNITVPEINPAISAIFNDIRTDLIRNYPEKVDEFSKDLNNQKLRLEFLNEINKRVSSYLPGYDESKIKAYSAMLLHQMFGIGKLEIITADENLEEIVANKSKSPVFVYHKKFGWLESNVKIDSEEEIYSYAQSIGRQVGRQITTLSPLMDAQLPSGDRVNATLAPISIQGNTLDIRKFRAEPWTFIDFIKNQTLTTEIVATLWEGLQYEMSIIVTGGTASGKTSMLNVLMPLMPPNQRIITIEDTHELVLPKFMHWVPLLTRPPNNEGKGEVSMLDLLINSLRMRPDRIVVGEVRRKEEVETLFEGLMTGHAVYATIHADTAQQVIKRLLSAPIELPEIELSAMDLILTAFRQRRTGIRRLREIAEIAETYSAGKMEIKANNIFEWNSRTDKIERTTNPSLKFYSKIYSYTGLSQKEIDDEINEKKKVIEWMLRKNVNGVDNLGYIIATYYIDKNSVLNIVEKDGDPQLLLSQYGKQN